MPELSVLRKGAKSKAAERLQAAINRRLRKRHIDVHLKTDGVVGEKTLAAARTAAWILGAEPRTYRAITKTGRIPIGVQRMILNPGKRTAAQELEAKKRLAGMLAARKKRAAEAHSASHLRKRIVELAREAAANYRANPGAYHYLAGGVANLEFLKPTPRTWRSDCSQFVASVYAAAGAPSPASVPHEYASTFSIVKCPHAKLTDHPRPGDLGLYGSRSGPLAGRFTHHVELYVGEPGAEFIGHGSPPIDSMTPGRPDFYVTFDFLD